MEYCGSSMSNFQVAGSTYISGNFHAYIQSISNTDGSLKWQETYTSANGSSFLSFSCSSTLLFASLIEYSSTSGELNQAQTSYLISYSFTSSSISQVSARSISEGSFSELS